MRKILGIMGSPRKKGNTHTMLLKILEGAQTEGAQTELILLANLTIKECDGCHSCWKGNECSKMDDMNNLFPKISESDIWIFGTPVYWYGPTALMKAFLDRFVYFNCPETRALIKGKSAILIIPFEEEHSETAEILIKMFEKSFKYMEVPIIDIILAPGVDKRGEVGQKEDIMKRCFELGKKIARS